ncbi:MAG: hypothetical protein KDA99_21415 [Planctomycetales bacterium]|nr:hypothetical protein [Planctomycetales bacterium]
MLRQPLLHRFATFVSLCATTICTADLWAQVPTPTDTDTVPNVQSVMVNLPDGRKIEATDRMASWQLGKTLSLALALKARGGDDASFQESLAQAKAIAAALKLELPEPPEINSIADVWKAKDYLAGKQKSIAALLQARERPDLAGLTRLATEVIFAGTIYSPINNDDPDDSKIQSQINKQLVNQIKISSMRSGFASTQEVVSALGPLVKLIESNDNLNTDALLNTLHQLETILNNEQHGASVDGETPKPNRDNGNHQVNVDIDPTSNPLDAEAEKIVRQFVENRTAARELTLKLKPTSSACAALLDAATANAATAAYEEMFGDPSTEVTPRESQTVVRLRRITTDDLIANAPAAKEFPGGYAQVAPHLKPGFVIYQFSFLEPGAEYGLRFDGLVKIEDQWYLFPKLWRAVSRP